MCDGELCKEVKEAKTAIVEVNARLAEGDEMFKDMKEFMSQFKTFMEDWPSVKEQIGKTAEVVAVYDNVKGFNNTMAFTGKFLKTTAVIGAWVAALVMVFKGVR